MSTPLFPLAVWLSGTNENSIPANDNAMRVQVLMAPAIDFADAEPGSPNEDDIYVIGTSWGGFDTGSVVIYKGGVWLVWEAFEGWVKVIDEQQHYFDGSGWVLGGGSGLPDAPSDGNTYGRKDADWEPISAGGAAPTVFLAGTSYTLGDLTPGVWHVFTASGAVTVTVEDDSAEPVPANAEYGLESRGAGGVELVEDNAAEIIPPKGGTLKLETGDFVVLKRTDDDEYKLIGSTESAS